MAVDNAFLLQIKVGDRVWRRGHHGIQTYIEKVTHITRTQIHIGNAVYDRSTGWRRGGLGGAIIGIPTPAEIADWDAKEAKEERERLDREAERQRKEEKRAELRGLFDHDSMTVRGAEWRDDGTYDVTFHGLTEDQVRALAKLTARPKATA